MNFGDMKLDFNLDTTEVKVNDSTTLTVKKYLPMEDKEKLVQFVIAMALDENTGCFSPLRLEVYFSIAVCRWYADIAFSEEDMKHIQVVYDALEMNDVFSKVANAIPEEEFQFMFNLVNDTAKDIARYNNSATGIINILSAKSEGLNEQLQAIFQTISTNEEARKALSNVIELGKKN